MDVTSVIIVIAAIAAFASVLAVGVPLMNRDQFASRLKAVAARRQELSARQRSEMKTAPRRVQPKRSAGIMRAVLGKLKLQEMLEAKDLKMRLAQAGWRTQTAPVTFTFWRVAAPVLFFAFSLLWVHTALAAKTPMTRMLVVVGATALGAYLPQMMLSNGVQKRQAVLSRAFPDTLDLLVICVEAGLSVEAALLRVTEEMNESSPMMAEEIGLTAAELAFLSERRFAWDNFAERTGLPQIKQLSTALVQAEKYGTPVGVALRTLATESRETRMATAEKKAASLPAKLTVPMILFFLPVLFLVIIGPAAINIMHMK